MTPNVFVDDSLSSWYRDRRQFGTYHHLTRLCPPSRLRKRNLTYRFNREVPLLYRGFQMAICLTSQSGLRIIVTSLLFLCSSSYSYAVCISQCSPAFQYSCLVYPSVFTYLTRICALCYVVFCNIVLIPKEINDMRFILFPEQTQT